MHDKRRVETKLYMSIYALLRFVTLLAYLGYNSGHLEQFTEYYYSNWLEMVVPASRSQDR